MEILELNEDLVIGAGGHKKVYIDPRDNKRCVKILLEEKCEDWIGSGRKSIGRYGRLEANMG